MPSTVQGIIALVASGIVWGLSPLYYNLLNHIPPPDLLAHRTIWSLAFFAAFLGVRGRLAEVSQAIRAAPVRIALAAWMISINWFLFIVAVQIGRVTETSLGYYIFPLVAVLLGRLFFGERLTGMQRLAVGLASLGVIILTVGLNVAPWISLTLAASFGLYGYLKKRMQAGATVSVTAEVVILIPFAVLWLGWRYLDAPVPSLTDTLMLSLTGLLTAVPLMLFSYASQRLTLATVGLVQYLNPTLQFLCATVVFGEPFGPVHLLTFMCIWTALAIYSISAFRQENARRKARTAASTSGTF